jgi:large conductance mechanosensitive channel
MGGRFTGTPNRNASKSIPRSFCRKEREMIKEFKEFITRGNVLELAVAFIIGAAFAKIVNSLVNDLLMPPFGLLLGKVDFSALYVSLSGQHYASLAEAKAAGAPTLNYGVFINTVIEFLIVAFAIFLIVRSAGRIKRKREEAVAAPVTKECPHCISAVPLRATRCPACTSALISP